MHFSLRPIRPQDNIEVAEIIRQVMTELGASGPGFAIHDVEVASMYEAYHSPGCAYFVVVEEGKIIGGGGIAPLQGEPEVCELRKMYSLPRARGRGIGQALLKLCLEEARRLGYRRCYLETLKTMTAAKKLYEKNQFRPVRKPMGNTGHFGCDAWYVADL